VQRKVEVISRQLAGVLAAWPEVEAVVPGEAAESRVLGPPDHYWSVLLESSQRAFSYTLNDLQASTLREDPELDRARKCEIASLLARSALSMV